MTITTQERTSLIQLAVLMFDAAPGATYLATLATTFEALGRDLARTAVQVSGSNLYRHEYPDTQSASAFATSFLTPLGLQGNATAVAFVTTRMQAGASKGQIAYDAMMALNATTSSEFANAKAILANETEVAEYFSVTQANPETVVATLRSTIATITADHATVDAAITPASPPSPPAVAQQEINLTSASDTYTIGAGNFKINGLGGDDTITTGNGQNTVTTLGGNDSVTTGSGADTVSAGDGNNTVNAGDGANVVTTGTGNDTITTGSGDDRITSGSGNDTIRAGAGADTVTSGAGGDSIDLGVDSAADRVVFAATAVTNGSDVVTSFTTGVDKLDVHAMTSGPTATVVSGALTVQAGTLYFLASALTSVADSVSASAAAIQGAATWTNGTTGISAFFVVNDNNSSAIYEYVEAGGAGISLGELTLMGTVDAKVVTGDLAF